MKKKLVVSDGTRERELQLVGRIVVGRDPACEISRDDSLLSRRHAEFVTAGDVVTVRDLGSRNGMFVNGTRAAEHVLLAGDIVQIGPLRARFVIEDAPSSIAPEDMDVERTAVFRRASAPAAAGAPAERHAAVVTPDIADIDDEGATRLIPAPRTPKVVRPTGEPLSSAAREDDEDRTRFMSAPQVSQLPPLIRPAAVAQAEHGLSTFVFVQLLTLAAVILVAATLPLLMRPRALQTATVADGAFPPLVWLALPPVVAMIAVYFVGTLINRRITGALKAIERN